MISMETHKFAKLLRIGAKQDAINYLRDRFSKTKFEDPGKQFAWKSWLCALERKDPSSLITQLLEGVDAKNTKKIIRELKAMQKIIKQQDPISKNKNKAYFHEWFSLLQEYQEIPPPPVLKKDDKNEE